MEYQLDKKLELSEKSARESADELFKLAQAVSSDATAIRQKAESDAKSRRKALDSQMSELSAADKSGAASKVTDSLTASLSAASTLLGRPAGIEASSTLESESLGHAAYVRVGRVQINGHSEVDVPALVPLLNHGNLIVRSDADSTDAAHELIHQLTFRALTQTFPGQLELQVFDPKLSGSFSDFRKLREQSLFPEPGDSSADLAELLDATSDRVARITENLGRTRDLGDLRAISGQPIEHYTLLVLLDFPTNASQESLSLLERIVDRGPRAGISTIIHHDLGARGASDIDLSGLTGRGWVIDLTGKRPSVERYPNDAVVLDPPPDGDLVLESVNAIAATAKTGAAPKVLFSELIPTNATPAESSSDGVTATFAKKGLEPVSIRLGDESEQRHHVLVAGASGQGKSNLLLALIHSLAARYGPEELEMYLVDLKRGLEFTSLGPGDDRDFWLPNTKVLAVESDREFGLAVLQYMVAEFNRRTSLIKQSGDSIATYREHNPDSPMPRILLVIDEFQTLFEEDDSLAEAALKALQQLARLARAAGIHIVLASQTLTGIPHLPRVEGAIMGQFPTRLVLKTSPSESIVVLSQGNTEPSELRYRGEVVINHDFGAAGKNSRATVAFAKGDELDALRQNLWRKAGSPAGGPEIFYANRAAEYRAAPASTATAFVGMPIGVDVSPVGFSFAEDPGRHIAILGSGDTSDAPQDSSENDATPPSDMGIGIIQSAIRSLAEHHNDGEKARIVIADYLPEALSREAALTAIAKDVSGASVELEVLRGPAANAAIVDLGVAVGEGRQPNPDGPTYLFVVQPERAPQFTEATDGIFEHSPSEQLKALLEKGSMQRTHVIGWWNSVGAYTGFDWNVESWVDGVIAMRISQTDVSERFGHGVDWTPKAHRALFWDKKRQPQPVSIVPFAASSATVMA